MELRWWRLVGHLYAMTTAGVVTFMTIKHFLRPDKDPADTTGKCILLALYWVLSICLVVGIELKKLRMVKFFRSGVLYRAFLSLIVLTFYAYGVIWDAYKANLNYVPIDLRFFTLALDILAIIVTVPFELWILFRVEDYVIQAQEDDAAQAANLARQVNPAQPEQLVNLIHHPPEGIEMRGPIERHQIEVHEIAEHAA